MRELTVEKSARAAPANASVNYPTRPEAAQPLAKRDLATR
jgi:hypothetical protein